MYDCRLRYKFDKYDAQIIYSEFIALITILGQVTDIYIYIYIYTEREREREREREIEYIYIYRERERERERERNWKTR